MLVHVGGVLEHFIQSDAKLMLDKLLDLIILPLLDFTVQWKSE